jgi:CheY-like chemotaxis protein
MDIRMPEMDGLTATRTTRQMDVKLGHIPFIAMTANATSEDVEQTHLAGMNAFVSKPVNKNKLQQALNNVLQNPDANNEFIRV